MLTEVCVTIHFFKHKIYRGTWKLNSKTFPVYVLGKVFLKNIRNRKNTNSCVGTTDSKTFFGKSSTVMLFWHPAKYSAQHCNLKPQPFYILGCLFFWGWVYGIVFLIGKFNLMMYKLTYAVVIIFLIWLTGKHLNGKWTCSSTVLWFCEVLLICSKKHLKMA